MIKLFVKTCVPVVRLLPAEGFGMEMVPIKV
jgi:hypothetical protein